MSELWVSMLERHMDALRTYAFQADGNERAAYVFFSRSSVAPTPWHESACELLISHAVDFVRPEHVQVSSPWEITWSTNDVVQKLKRAGNEGLILGIVHNHAAGHCAFSHVDDGNEAELTKTIQNRDGESARLVSVLLTPDGQWRARQWTSPARFTDASELRIIGRHFSYAGGDPTSMGSSESLGRQALALGEAFNQSVRRMRIAVVGAGGTGSAIAMLLARLGVGAIAVIDPDRVETSNLNRLHGASMKDAGDARLKVEAVTASIRAMGLGTNVVPLSAWIADPRCRDILRSAHIVFGCTDDHAGRVLLNRFAYYYQIPVIDMGLAIQLADGTASVQAMDGRVTVLTPGDACLLCRGVINPRRAAEEVLKRQDPDEFERRKREAYVLGEENPSPAVITFTTELACMALNEMIHRLQGFRGPEGSTANRVRLFHRMTDLRPSRAPDPECRVCGQPAVWSLGDTEPFLGIVS